MTQVELYNYRDSTLVHLSYHSPSVLASEADEVLVEQVSRIELES
jgi:hypothetical protein